jgi:maltooligosyltrehalose trehalohydrolase
MSKIEPKPSRQLSAGAEILADETAVHFRVWAPERKRVRVVFEDGPAALNLDREDGYFSGLAEGVGAGHRYKYELDGEDPYPDPAARYQPHGPHGYSEVINSSAFRWSDDKWTGIKLRGQVIYEMHVGTFTKEGTWGAAAERLQYLRDTGITVIELMPVADFPGRFGWGYDGVGLYAPTAIYGTPNEMQAFVNKAHSFGLAVILDVVYNHLGPDGNYLSKYSPFYFSNKYSTDWGPAINYDDEHSKSVREFFRENACYWIREFHLDGLRLDATQAIHDSSNPHILAEINCAVRETAGNRSVVLIGENEPQDTNLLRETSAGGYGLDALWNDDYHHAAMVALTGKAEAYYSDYRGSAQEFVSAAKYGYLFQGQWYRWQKRRRGSPTLRLPREAMVNFIQNHDQVANSARGLRAHEMASPGVYKALTALTLLMPGTPMLFQGQEFAASSPFLFFADHKPELAKKIREGRVKFLEQWQSLRQPDIKKCFADPTSMEAFERSRLDHEEVTKHREIYALHKDLLSLRREDPVIAAQGRDGLDGAVLGPACFVLRFFSPDFQNDRILLVNLGTDLEFDPAPEPLLAPPLEQEWKKLWSSDDACYGGCGTAPLGTETWRVPGQAAVLLRPVPIKVEPKSDERKPNS